MKGNYAVGLHRFDLVPGGEQKIESLQNEWLGNWQESICSHTALSERNSVRNLIAIRKHWTMQDINSEKARFVKQENNILKKFCIRGKLLLRHTLDYLMSYCDFLSHTYFTFLTWLHIRKHIYICWSAPVSQLKSLLTCWMILSQ